MSKYGVSSGSYFPIFGLNTEIHRVNPRIQSKYEKIRTRKNYVFGHFLHSGKHVNNNYGFQTKHIFCESFKSNNLIKREVVKKAKYKVFN